MEDWQKEQIKTNLSSLVNNTSVNVVFLAELQQEDVLSDIEVEQIMAKTTSYDQAKLLYEIIVTKSNSYYTLIKALTETQQSGATKYLFHPSERIRSLRVNFQEKTQQLGNLLNHNQIQAIHTWLLNSNFSESERKAITKILNDQKEVKLLRDTIPKPYALYIPRFVSIAQNVDPNLFKKSCPDTFVFKNVQRSYLSNFVNPYEIESSTRLLLQKKIFSRFILLDSVNDWKKICAKIQKTPVHLLKYDEETDAFVVEATTGSSEILREHLKYKHANPEYISEEDFVEQIINKNVKGVCICDSPGMGKSDLLASVARRVNEKCPVSITSFIQLRDFAIPKNLSDCKKIIFDHITTSQLASQILYELTKDGNTQFNLFFDGLDEVHGTNLETMTTYLHEIGQSMPLARLFVTSRPVVRTDLEKSVGLIAYDIMPLNKATQKKYLTSFWIQENPTCDKEKLNEFAEFCVQNFGKALKTNIKTVSGVPLQCQLIAKVYSDDAAIYADKDRKVLISLPENVVNSLSEIYSKFMLRQLGPSKCRFACMHKIVSSGKPQCDVVCKVKSFHVWQALRLIDKDFADKIMMKEYITEFHDLTPNQVLSPGILKPGKSEDTYEFLHRTFAEFLGAEYCAKVLFSKPSHSKRNKRYDKIAKEFLFGQNLFNYSDPIRVTLESEFMVGVKSIKEALLPYFVNVSLIDCYCAGDELCVGVLCPGFESSFLNLESCLHADYQSLLNVLLQGIQNFEQQPSSRLLKVVNRARYAMLQDKEEVLPQEIDVVLSVLQVAAQYSDVTTINQLFQFFQDALNFDVTKLTKLKNDPHMTLPLPVAVYRGDFHVVEYLTNKFNLKNSQLLYWCFKDTYDKNEDFVEIKLKIAQLLISKQADLLTEKFVNQTYKPFDDNYIDKGAIPVILVPRIHFKAIKFLVKAGVNVKTVDTLHRNVYIHALDYMSDEDFEYLRNFLFIECNAQNWFLDLENHKKYFCPYGDYHIEREKTMLRFLQNMVKETALVHKNENAKTDLLRSEAYKGLFFHAVATGRIEIVDYFLEQDPTFLEQRHSEEHPKDLYVRIGFGFGLDVCTNFNKPWKGYHCEPDESKPSEWRHSENVTPILFAAKFCQTEMVRFLINRRANIFAVDAKGRTILHLSAISGKNEPFEQIVRMIGEMENTSLPSYPKDSNSQREPASFHELFNWHDNEEQNTPLHKAARYIDLSPECLSLFLSCGGTVQPSPVTKLEPSPISGERNDNTISVNVNAVNACGQTGLHVALIHKKKLEVVDYLIKKGTDWKITDKNGCNVLHMCAHMDFPTYLNYFLVLGGEEIANQLDRNGQNALECGFVHVWRLFQKE